MPESLIDMCTQMSAQEFIGWKRLKKKENKAPQKVQVKWLKLCFRPNG